MQVAVELTTQMMKELKNLSLNKQKQAKLIQTAIAEKLTRIRHFQNDSFTRWVLDKKQNFQDKKDVGQNHDHYLYGEKK